MLIFMLQLIVQKTVDLGGGFFTSDEYYIELTNHDALPSGIYLVGEGEVYCS